MDPSVFLMGSGRDSQRSKSSEISPESPHLTATESFYRHNSILLPLRPSKSTPGLRLQRKGGCVSPFGLEPLQMGRCVQKAPHSGSGSTASFSTNGSPSQKVFLTGLEGCRLDDGGGADSTGLDSDTICTARSRESLGRTTLRQIDNTGMYDTYHEWSCKRKTLRPHGQGEEQDLQLYQSLLQQTMEDGSDAEGAGPPLDELPNIYGIENGARLDFVRRLVACTGLLPLRIIKDQNCATLDLAHKSLGDAYVIALSESIDNLPNLTSLNLMNNRLTDVGIQCVIRKVREISLKSVNIGMNDLDAKSAHEMDMYLESSTCTLEELRLPKTDTNDSEVAHIMGALCLNRSLKLLDLSNNCIGGNNEKMADRDGHKGEGGASIGRMLSANSTLTWLDLSWNQLGVESGILIGEAISGNNSVSWLNLANNSLGNGGGMKLGEALQQNSALTHLDLSDNGIGIAGITVMGKGLRQNATLKSLVVDGNKMGQAGGRALFQNFNSTPINRDYSIQRCDMDDDCLKQFDPRFPGGTFELGLEDPLQEAVAAELLRAANFKPGCSISQLIHTPPGGKPHTITLERPQNCPEEARMLWMARGPSTPADSSMLSYNRSTEAMQLWSESVYSDLEPKLRAMMLRRQGESDPWQIPETGAISIVVDYQPLPPCEIMLCNTTGLTELIEVMIQSPETRMEVLGLFSQEVFYTSKQVSQLVDELAGADSSLSAADMLTLFTTVLPQVYDHDALPCMVDRYLSATQKLFLMQRFGQAYPAFTGAVCGHYLLDLSLGNHRLVGMRLVEQANYEKQVLQQITGWPIESGGTSQHANWSSFRNEKFTTTGAGMSESPAIGERGLEDGFFRCGLRDKTPGMLEFDFVSCLEALTHPEPLNNFQLALLLNDCGLLDVASIRTFLGGGPSALLETWLYQLIQDAGLVIGTIPHVLPGVPFVAPALSQSNQGVARRVSAAGRRTSFASKAAPGHHTPGVLRWLTKQGISTEALPRLSRELLKLHVEMKQDVGMSSEDEGDSKRLSLSRREKSERPRKRVTMSIHGFRLRVRHCSRQECLAEVFEVDSDASVGEDSMIGGGASASASVGESVLPGGAGSCWVASKRMVMLGGKATNGMKAEAANVIMRLFGDLGVDKEDLVKGRISIATRQHMDVSNNVELQEVFVPPALRPLCQSDGKEPPLVPLQLVVSFVDAYIPDLPASPPDNKFTSGGREYTWVPLDASEQVLNLSKHPDVEICANNLRARLGSAWLTSSQIKSIAALFPENYQGEAYRNDAIVRMFGRCVDIERFPGTVLHKLPARQMEKIIHRLGLLNIASPENIDSFYELNLMMDDHRRFTDMIVKLGGKEPGTNLLGVKFRRYFHRTVEDYPWITHWEIPEMWDDTKYTGPLEAGIPRNGHLILRYATAKGLSASHSANRLELMSAYTMPALILKHKKEQAQEKDADGNDWNFEGV